MGRQETGMRYRALTAALPQGQMNASVGRVLACQAVEQANRMQQATRDPASQGLPGRRREHPALLHRSRRRSCWPLAAP